MIIDVHGHYTTAPPALRAWRLRQKDAIGTPFNEPLNITDDELCETLEAGQLKLQRDRGTDMTLFSPTAGGMEHHVGPPETSLLWSRTVNDIIKRVSTLYPDNFVPVCQLPQSPGVSPKNCIEELERCVNEMGFVGANLNPGPVGRLLDRPADVRQVVVPAVREAGGAGSPDHDPRQRLLQPQLPRHGRALHQRETPPSSCRW